MTNHVETLARHESASASGSDGIHHITAITRDVKANVRFYTEVLGLRLVKRTVNFDDPGAHHLYYGDERGTPGSILTFFAWEGAHAGQLGLGQAVEIAFRIPQGSLGWWTQRLVEAGIVFDAPEKRFGDTVLGFKDPDGIRIELVASSRPAPAATPWTGGPIGDEHAVQGFDGITLWLEETAGTAAILEKVLGYEPVGQEGTRSRFLAKGSGPARVVDLRAAPGFLAGRMGTGTVHHVAFRASSDAAQSAMAEVLDSLGGRATEQLDRTYFRSIYFREPGGVIFEIATDDPGFTVDESLEALGTSLKLPQQYESRRADIEAALPPLE